VRGREDRSQRVGFVAAALGSSPATTNPGSRNFWFL